MFKQNTKVRIVHDAAGDLPKSIIGRRGVVKGRNKHANEHGHSAYYVSVVGWKKPKTLWDDEIVRVKPPPRAA